MHLLQVFYWQAPHLQLVFYRGARCPNWIRPKSSTHLLPRSSASSTSLLPGSPETPIGRGTNLPVENLEYARKSVQNFSYDIQQTKTRPEVCKNLGGMLAESEIIQIWKWNPSLSLLGIPEPFLSMLSPKLKKKSIHRQVHMWKMSHYTFCFKGLWWNLKGIRCMS